MFSRAVAAIYSIPHASMQNRYIHAVNHTTFVFAHHFPKRADRPQLSACTYNPRRCTWSWPRVISATLRLADLGGRRVGRFPAKLESSCSGGQLGNDAFLAVRLELAVLFGGSPFPLAHWMSFGCPVQSSASFGCGASVVAPILAPDAARSLSSGGGRRLRPLHPTEPVGGAPENA